MGRPKNNSSGGRGDRGRGASPRQAVTNKNKTQFSVGGGGPGPSGKKASRQIRVDEILQPRRSQRRLSSVTKKEGKDLKLNAFEIEAGKGRNIKLLDVQEEEAKTAAAKKLIPSSTLKKGVPLSEEKQRELLSKFDLNPIYGPCRGIQRRQRLSRALKFGIKPTPEELIIKILNEHADDSTFQTCVWDQHELLKLRN